MNAISSDRKTVKQLSIPDFFRRYPVLVILASVTLIADTCYMTVIPLVPFYFRSHFHVRHEIIIGITLSAFVLTETLLKPFAGWAGDRVRRTHLIAGGLLVASITPFFLARAGSPIAFLAIRFIDGMTAAALWPAMVALFADATDEDDRATAMSIFTMCMAVSAGVGFTLSPFLRAQFGSYAYVFISMSALMGTAFVTVLVSMKRIRGAIQKQVESQVVRHAGGLKENLRKIRAHPALFTQLCVLIFLAFTQMFATSMLTPTALLFVHDQLHWAESHLWKVFIAVGAFMGLISLPAGRLADRIGKENSVKAGMVIFALCLLIMAILKQPWTLALAVVGYGVSFVLGAPAWMALVTRGEWAGMRGTVLGIVTAFQGAGTVLGPTVGTFIYHLPDAKTLHYIDKLLGPTLSAMTYHWFGHYAPFTATGTIMTLCAAVSLLWLRPVCAAKSE
jgi:MFS family permease